MKDQMTNKRNMYAKMWVEARKNANYFAAERDMLELKLKFRDMVIDRLEDDLKAAKRNERSANIACTVVFVCLVIAILIAIYK